MSCSISCHISKINDDSTTNSACIMIKQRIIGYISDINTEWLINILLISAIRSFVSEDARTDTVLSLWNSAEFRYSYLKNISRTSTFWAKATIRGKLVAGSGKCKKLYYSLELCEDSWHSWVRTCMHRSKYLIGLALRRMNQQPRPAVFVVLMKI